MPGGRLTFLITGASGYIGGAVAERIIHSNDVRSLTAHPGNNRFGGSVESFPYDFEHPHRMADAFSGADVFINTYYIRFKYADATFERAVAHTRVLLELARDAGVRAVVHVSVSNARDDSELPYYRNKGAIEKLVRGSGLEYTILRPAIVVGAGDILVNNIAYFLRRLPVFTVFGRGEYRVQPMTLDAFADIVVRAAAGAFPNQTISVAGPRDWTFLEMVHAIRAAIGSRAAIVGVPAPAALAALKIAGIALGDVVLTADEVKGLTREYLWTPHPHREGPDLAAWLSQPNVASTLGARYASELARHFDRRTDTA